MICMVCEARPIIPHPSGITQDQMLSVIYLVHQHVGSRLLHHLVISCRLRYSLGFPLDVSVSTMQCSLGLIN